MPYDVPLYAKLVEEAQKNRLRMHMPGHKGRAFDAFANTDIYAIDYTELASTGNLYEGTGPVHDAELLTAKAYGAEDCMFLTGGSTQGVMTALGTVCRPGDTVIADRGCHKSVFNAMVHLDLNPVYIFPDRLYPWDISVGVTPLQIDQALKDHGKVSAVIITSPTYYSVLSDIAGISAVCKDAGVPLIVDEAHGAHLPFIDGFCSAAAQGADLTAVSAHKTLPALTSAAFILSNGRYGIGEIRKKAAMFGTSSPSYPIMASIDLSRAYLEGEGGVKYQRIADALKEVRAQINSKSGFAALTSGDGVKTDPARLTVCTSAGGISGFDAAKILDEKHGIVCEMADSNNIVMIMTCADSTDDLARVQEAILSLRDMAIPKKYTAKPRELPLPFQKFSPRQAAYAEKTYLRLQDCAGSVAGENISPYPPGIPVVAAGEVITSVHIDSLRDGGFDINREIAVIL